jgi:DNA-binding NtrC family response regulator
MPTANLLLVDDEQAFVETMTRRLIKRDFSVTCAFNGEEALKRLETDETLDAVILDLRMPGKDGIEIIRLIKEKHPLVEIIMLTGHAEVNSAVEAIKQGAFDYLMKPCDLDELISKVKNAVSRKKRRETKILEVRMLPYISKSEKNKRIAGILSV